MGGDGEDVFQEGMIGLYKAIITYNDTKDAVFFTYATVCIKRQILDAIKASSRFKHSAINNSVSIEKISFDKMASDFDLLDSIIENEERLDRFKKINEKLNSEEQAILREYLDGKSYNEIAERFGLKSKDIDNSLSKIKRKLKS